MINNTRRVYGLTRNNKEWNSEFSDSKVTRIAFHKLCYYNRMKEVTDEFELEILFFKIFSFNISTKSTGQIKLTYFRTFILWRYLSLQGFKLWSCFYKRFSIEFVYLYRDKEKRRFKYQEIYCSSFYKKIENSFSVNIFSTVLCRYFLNWKNIKLYVNSNQLNSRFSKLS